jgi:hypothetical protein
MPAIKANHENHHDDDDRRPRSCGPMQKTSERAADGSERRGRRLVPFQLPVPAQTATKKEKNIRWQA